jgi:hypothetical protein
MKTAQEWIGELKCFDPLEPSHIMESDVKQIQLDAWKQGMTDASQICDMRADYDPDRDGRIIGNEIVKQRDEKETA